MLSAATLLFVYAGASSERTAGETAQPPLTAYTIPAPDAAEVMASVRRFADERTDRTYRAGIVPHHLLADKLIAHFFAVAFAPDVERIIVVSPNHQEAGSRAIITSMSAWNTDLGTAQGDADLATALVSRRIAGFDDTVVRQEHGFTNLVPYIVATHPVARITPVLLKLRPTERELASLSDFLSEAFDERTALVVSADFAHGLSAVDANQRDAATQQALESLNREYFRTLDAAFSETVDTPNGIAVLFTVLERHGERATALLAHENSSTVTSRIADEVTSYFEVGYAPE